MVTYPCLAETVPTLNAVSENGIIKIALPLKSGSCIFPLNPHETLHQFLNTIRLEDNNVNTLSAYSAEDNARISHTIILEDLLKSDFILEIDSVRYLIKVHEHLLDDPYFEETLHVNDIDQLVQRAYAAKIRKQIEKDPRIRMPITEFYSWCNDYGLNDKQSHVLLRSLKHCGLVVHFPENEDLSKYLFLKTDTIFNALGDSLNMSLLRKSDLTKLSELMEIKEKLKLLDIEKQSYDAQAARYARHMLWGCMAYLVTQFLVLARMVWIDFNWDIMEPITFFVTYTTIMGGYLFFLFTAKDYTYPQLTTLFENRKLRSLYIANRFNWKEWNELTQRKEKLEKDLNM